MIDHILLMHEPFFTEGTDIEFCISTYVHMSFQVLDTRKFFRADCTLVLFGFLVDLSHVRNDQMFFMCPKVTIPTIMIVVFYVLVFIVPLLCFLAHLGYIPMSLYNHDS